MHAQKFKAAALGGTFDILHIGHERLLRKAFEISDEVVIGLSSDEFAKRRGKSPVHSYEDRRASLEAYLKDAFPGRKFTIAKLENNFGPTITDQKIEALVASEETSPRIDEMNEIRAEHNAKPVKLVTVPLARDGDGKIISTTRIRNKEIDREGNPV